MEVGECTSRPGRTSYIFLPRPAFPAGPFSSREPTRRRAVTGQTTQEKAGPEGRAPIDPPSDRGATSPRERAALSRELSEFLVELSIGVHRYAMYPSNHPSLAPVVENVIGRLAEIFESGGRSLSIGVARRQLVIEGVATDPKHPVLADLAKRLHEHQLAALSFSRGTQGREVEGLLTTLARDTERDAEPIGLLPPDELPSWEHVRVYPVGYDQLAIRDDSEEEAGDGSDRATELWLGLAQAAIAGEEPIEAERAEDVDAIAETIREHEREEAYDQVIVGYLHQIAGELKDARTGESEKVRARLSRLIREIDDATLRKLVELGGEKDQRRQFLLDANHSLAVDSVVKILKAAASAEGQTISTSLTRLLTKLAGHAESGPEAIRNQADTALRENVEELIEDWKLDDPNPDQYTGVLDAMAQASPIFDRSEVGPRLAGPERILQMALEVDTWGTTVEKAVSDMLDGGMTGRLLALVEGAPTDSSTAERVRGHLTRPEALRKVLAGEDVDVAALDALVDRMGDRAIDPLLEVLAESDSRSVRRRVFDALARLGSDVAERAVGKLDDPRWFVVRNMLALLARASELPDGFDPVPYTKHADERVRREAFVLAIREAKYRARTLAAALGERDERLVRMALLELGEGAPETLVPTVVNRILRSDHPPELRAMAVRVLEPVRSPSVRDALVALAEGGRSLLGKVKVADRAPDVVAALSVLGRRWSGEDSVKPLLKAAARSKDPAIRGAVEVEG